MNPYLTNVILNGLGKAALPLLLIGVLHAENVTPRPAQKMRDAATSDDLALKFRAAEQQDPMRHMKISKLPDPSKVNQPESLLATSDIICFGGMAVLVPKRAILQLPPKLVDRLKMQVGCPFVSWADFYAANRGWITTVEVSRVQAEGNLDLDKKTHERISKSNNLIVATFLTGPISVLPLKGPVVAIAQSNP